MATKKWKIEKRSYSSSPWRLIGDDGEEVYQDTMIDHPDLGAQRISMPVCGKTKEEVIEQVLSGLVKLRSVAKRQQTSLRIIGTWAKCWNANCEPAEKAMRHIADECQRALTNGQ